MADETTAKAPVAIHLRVVYPEEPLPIACTTFAKFSHFGGQVMMDLGLLDDQALIKAIVERAEGAAVNAYVLHRYGMSIETFQLLRKNIAEIAAKMAANGLLGEDAPKDGK